MILNNIIFSENKDTLILMMSKDKEDIILYINRLLEVDFMIHNNIHKTIISNYISRIKYNRLIPYKIVIKKDKSIRCIEILENDIEAKMLDKECIKRYIPKFKYNTFDNWVIDFLTIGVKGNTKEDIESHIFIDSTLEIQLPLELVNLHNLYKEYGIKSEDISVLIQNNIIKAYGL